MRNAISSIGGGHGQLITSVGPPRSTPAIPASTSTEAIPCVTTATAAAARFERSPSAKAAPSSRTGRLRRTDVSTELSLCVAWLRALAESVRWAALARTSGLPRRCGAGEFEAPNSAKTRT